MLFDLDALADIEYNGHRLVFNAAFAAHGLNIEWTVARYRKLLALSDESQRVTAELRARGIATECDVLNKLLVDEIVTTKTMLFEEMILDADVSPRPGLIDLIMDAFVAGILVGVVTGGARRWSEPLVRQLVGDGLVATIVTADDVSKPMPDPEAYRLALWELGVPAQNALAFTGSAAGLRTANSAGLATVLVNSEGADVRAAAAVRSDYGGVDPLHIADCQRLHERRRGVLKPSAA